MLGNSFGGAFRSVFGRQAAPAGRLSSSVASLLRRNLSYARPSSQALLQWRTAVAPRAFRTLRRRLGDSSAFAQATQRMGASRSSKRTFHWSRSRRSQSGAKGEEAESQSLSGRLRKLSREYGWAAVGVYLGLSVLDFPFCFLLVRTVGTDKIAEMEHWVVFHAKALVPPSVKERWHQYCQSLKQAEKEELGDNEPSPDAEMAGWGVKQADRKNKTEPSLATQLALAYAIHKSFIFIRVPLTAAVTPKVVKVLRSWGWEIGKRTPKTPKA